MPIKPTKPPASASKSLVSVGPRHVSRTVKGKQVQDEGVPKEKASTTRALVLRNGKHGARGTGELMLMKKMTGREKFELIAEEEIKMAIMPPFSLEKCLKISESQYDAYLDDIANLRDPDLFRYIIEAELQARTRPGSQTRRNATYVAKVVGTRIHNAYLLASAWKMVQDTLNGLTIDGLSDRTIKAQLKDDKDMRDRFLVLYDIVNVLVEMSHAKFSVLATTTPHYAKYFKKSEVSAPGEEEMVFDWKDLRGAADSFLDSIIIELCFPRAPYPKAILYRILHDAIGESPREAKRFPQALWDAVGDLSESVELQQYLEGVLSGPDGQSWKKSARKMPEEYELWIDAQILSSKASAEIANFKDSIFPLEKTRQTVVLDNMWKFINLNYQAVSGHKIDTLWQLEGELDYAPQWSSYYIPELSDDSDDDSDDPPRLLPASKAGKKKHKTLAITDGADEGNGSMPELQSVSNSSDDDPDSDSDSDHDDDEDDEGDSDGSDYDEEAEDEIREMLREAMDAAHEADWFETNVSPELDPFVQEDRKGNPFLKLLGSLRGRMFPSSPKLKTPGTRTEVRPGIRGAFRATPSGVPKSLPTTGPPKAVPVSAKVTTTAPSAKVEPPKNLKTTIEEVEDEDDAPLAPKKKKKKSKKKKKPAPASPEPQDVSRQSFSTSPTPAGAPKLSTPLQAPASPSPKRNQAAPRPSPAKPAQPQVSTTSLAIPTEPTTAQSAHSYLRTLEEREKVKEKIKSRPDHASLFSNPEKEKKGFFSKLSGGLKRKDDATPKNAKYTWFSKLSKKTTGYMHQLLATGEDTTQGMAPMKWENFLKLMREMGFDYDPSTAGSSVRFDPPNKSDKPITFHKPHPDPTLQPVMLKAFAKRLKRQYGWTEQDFLNHVPGSK